MVARKKQVFLKYRKHCFRTLTVVKKKSTTKEGRTRIGDGADALAIMFGDGVNKSTPHRIYLVLESRSNVTYDRARQTRGST